MRGRFVTLTPQRGEAVMRAMSQSSHPSMQRVADKAGVSRNTVSRALRNDPRISIATKTKIRRIAEQLGYRPNPRVSELMAQLSRGRRRMDTEVVAFVRCRHRSHKEPPLASDARVMQGMRRRGGQIGCQVEDFALIEGEMSAARLREILGARGIRGAILEVSRHLPADLADLYGSLACAVVGRAPPAIPLNRAVSNHYLTMARALEVLRDRGYRRVGYYGLNVTDRNINHAWSAALAWHHREMRTDADVLMRNVASWDEVDFFRWIRDANPEVVVTNHRPALVWLRSTGKRVPEDVGFVDIDLSPSSGPCAGMDQRLELIGAAALDLVARQLIYHELGPPDYVTTVMIEAEWCEGATIKRVTP